jgi:hypothetical protein
MPSQTAPIGSGIIPPDAGVQVMQSIAVESQGLAHEFGPSLFCSGNRPSLTHDLDWTQGFERVDPDRDRGLFMEHQSVVEDLAIAHLADITPSGQSLQVFAKEDHGSLLSGVGFFSWRP